MLAVDVNDIDLTRAADHWAGSLAIAMSFYVPSLDDYLIVPPSFMRFASRKHSSHRTSS